jgi:hypothetical protein
MVLGNMFAPPVAQAKSQSVSHQRSHFGPQRLDVTRIESGAHETGDESARVIGREVAPSWDLSKISIFSSGRKTGAKTPPESLPSRLPGPIQAKLKVGAVNDPLEHEADRVADRVMRTPESKVSITTVTPQISRKCAGCEEEENLQRKSAGVEAVLREAPGLVHEVLRSPGRPLDSIARAYFESRFGHDFSRVRVHTDGPAAASAEAIKARAYTVGSEVVFGGGQFSPATTEGKKLLAHELAHVAQQNGETTTIRRQPTVATHSQPASDTRWRQDEKAARYRGQLMARRIRNHTKLSKEARAKINSELAYFEGAAKEAYIKEVRPALLAVTEIEMPPEQMVPRAPRPIGLSLLADDPRAMTDEEIYAPLTEAKKRDDAEAARLKQAQIEELRNKTRGWGADQAFAIGLLEGVLRNTTNPDPRGVANAIRQPIMDRLLKWLKEGDQARLAACAKHDPGLVEKIRDKFQDEDPCVSWFDTSRLVGHGPSELQQLERILNLHRKYPFDTAVDQVYEEVLSYRKQTDPYWLEELRRASGLVNAGLIVSGAAGEMANRGGAVPPPAEGPPPTVSGESAVPQSSVEPAPRGNEGAPPAASGPDPNVIQGGGESKSPPQGQLAPVGPDNQVGPPFQPRTSPASEPPKPAPGAAPNRPAAPQAANDNAARLEQENRQQKVASGGGDPIKTHPPQMVRRVVPSPPRKVKPGSVRPAKAGRPDPGGKTKSLQEHPVKTTPPPEETHDVRPGAPGQNYQARSVEMGNFAEANFNNLPDLLEDAGIHSKMPISETIPTGARKYRLQGYRGQLPGGRPPEIDALDRAGGRVYEVKSHGDYRQGLAEAEWYAREMDKLEPLPPVMGPGGKLIPRRWEARCVTYDADAVGQYIDRIRPVPEAP